MAKIPTVTAEKSIDTGARTLPRIEAIDAVPKAMSSVASSVMTAATAALAREQQAQEALEDFTTNERYAQHSQNLAQRIEALRREAPAGGQGLAVNATNLVAQENKKWLDSDEVPARLKQRYQARVGTLATTLSNKAADWELDDRNKYFETQVTAQAGQIGAGIANDPDTLLAGRDMLYGAIDRTTLPEAQKQALKSRHGMTIAQASIDGLIRQGRYDDAREVAASMAGYGRAENGGAIVMTDEKRAARDAIAVAAKQHGIPTDVAVMVATLESGLNWKAKNAKSSADGLFQIMGDERKAKGLEGAGIEQQAAYGVARLRQTGQELEAKGVPLTPVTLYMGHFQGPGATAAILKDGDANLKDTLDKVRPNWRGKNGETWGEAVTKQNNLDPAMTNQQFTDRITRRVNGAMIAAGTTELGFNERAALVDKTDTWIKADENRRKYEQREAIRQTKNLVDNDIASIQATGKEIGELTEQRVKDHIGEDGARQWVMAREQARRQYELTKDFDALPAQDLTGRLTELADDAQKAAGTERFNAAQATYETAQKKADQILKLRENDPARAVETDSSVKAAMAALNPAQPGTVQALVGARLAAQEKVGIPPNARMPITNREGRELASVIDSALPNERSKVLRQTVLDIQMRYGEFADQVMVAVAGQFVKDRETRELAGAVIKKIGMGEPVSIAEQARTDQALDADRSRQAMSGALPDGATAQGEGASILTAQGNAPRKDPASMNEVEKHFASFRPTKSIDRESFRRLLTSPETAPAFDQQFGRGAAAWVLKGVELTSGRGDRKQTSGTNGANSSQ